MTPSCCPKWLPPLKNDTFLLKMVAHSKFDNALLLPKMVAAAENDAFLLKTVANESKKERKRATHLEFMKRKEELEEVLKASKMSLKVKLIQLQDLSGTDSEGTEDDEYEYDYKNF